jgi:hypothetical protein
VDLALTTYNYEMAKKYASKSFIDPKLKKNLWLKIAKKILGVDEPGMKTPQQEALNVKNVLALLQEHAKSIEDGPESDNALKIDDLL